MSTAPHSALNEVAFDQLFRQGRTFSRFLPHAIPEEEIQTLYDLIRWGPTAFNSQPARFVAVRSPAAREKLVASVSRGNQPKVASAALSFVVAHDLDFPDDLPTFSANPQAKALFEQLPKLVEPTALRSAALQAGYLIMAARARGWDVGVLTGFDGEALARHFWPDKPRWQASVVINLGIGDPESLGPRYPRHPFANVVRVK